MMRNNLSQIFLHMAIGSGSNGSALARKISLDFFLIVLAPLSLSTKLLHSAGTNKSSK